MIRHGAGRHTCPDCEAEYFGAVFPFQSCPSCEAAKAKVVKEYWDEKRAGMRSIASNIVSQILAGGN